MKAMWGKVTVETKRVKSYCFKDFSNSVLKLVCDTY